MVSEAWEVGEGARLIFLGIPLALAPAQAWEAGEGARLSFVRILVALLENPGIGGVGGWGGCQTYPFRYSSSPDRKPRSQKLERLVGVPELPF